MKINVLNMFNSENIRVELSDIISKIKSNDLIWHIFYYYGIGLAPNNLSMDEFEQVIKENSEGFIMTWEELNVFAQQQEQTFDCIIVGKHSDVSIKRSEVLEGNYENCFLVVEAFDSTEWRIHYLED